MDLSGIDLCFFSSVCFLLVLFFQLTSVLNISSYLPIIFLPPSAPSAFPLISSFLLSPPRPILLLFSSRALFLGLSNNPHITDLHLDISSCEVRSVSLCSRCIRSSSSYITSFGYHIMFLPSSACRPQLRSAGAGVIQELFPRVSCVGTLDISDNGKNPHRGRTYMDCCMCVGLL